MAETNLISVEVYEENGEFHFSYPGDDGPLISQPFTTYEEAVDAATDFLEEVFTAATKSALLGE